VSVREFSPRDAGRAHPLVELTTRLQQSRAETMGSDVRLAADLDHLGDNQLREERDRLATIVESAPHRRWARELAVLETARERLAQVCADRDYVEPRERQRRRRAIDPSAELALRRLDDLRRRENEMRAREARDRAA
jgi:hypothetical protein